MKIKETVERECCQSGDLLTYYGLMDTSIVHNYPKFCKYCGQIFIYDKEMDAAGSYETVLKKLVAGSDKTL